MEVTAAVEPLRFRFKPLAAADAATGGAAGVFRPRPPPFAFDEAAGVAVEATLLLVTLNGLQPMAAFSSGPPTPMLLDIDDETDSGRRCCC